MSKELRVLHSDVKAKVDAKKSNDWFYSDTVKDHFFNPRNFLRDKQEVDDFDAYGSVGSVQCGDRMEMWIKVDKKNDRIVGCKWSTFGSLIPGATILMADYTTKSVENLKIGDGILDGDGNVNFIQDIFCKEYNGKILTYRLSTSNFYNITVTPNHPIPCVPRKTIALINRHGERWSEVNRELIDSSKVEIFSAADIREGDFLIFKIPKEIEDIAELNYDLCTLLGYYVSDGFAKNKRRVRFDFGMDEEEYINEIINIANKYGWQYIVRQRKDSACLSLDIIEPSLVAMLTKYGGMPGKKRFSNEILKLPSKKQMQIVNAYIKGDGWETQQKENWNIQYFISTSLEHIAFQLQIMLARNWIFAPIHRRKPKKFIIRGKEYSNKGEYNVIFKKVAEQSRTKFDFDNYNILVPVSKIIVSDYIGKIYDIAISDKPHIYRVNGISVHNCGSAIASTSVLSVMITENGGMKIDDALKIKPQDIVKRLEELPARKYHCSVLGDKALRSAINDYFKKTKQYDRIVEEGAKMIDMALKITDKDIEEAVLEGAVTFEDLQKRTKIGIQDKTCIPEAKQLLKFYREKYFGKEA